MIDRMKRKSLWQGIIKPLLREHGDWYRRGQTGQGRIVMSDEDLQGADLRGLQGARLTRINFSGAGMNLMHDVEVTECAFDEALLQLSAWERATIENCSFRGAMLVNSRFTDARIRGGNWLGAWCDSTSWTRAAISNVSFVGACLTNSRFDEAVFTDCDFSRADLSRVNLATDAARCPGSRFIGCDFRYANIDGLRFNNTTLDRCLFGGVRGKPDIEGPCTLIAPDFSSDGSGGLSSDGVPGIRDPEEVLRVWRDRDADYLRRWNDSGGKTVYEPAKNYPERRR